MSRVKWMTMIVALALTAAASAHAADSGNQNSPQDTQLDHYDISNMADARGRATAAAEQFTRQGFATNANDLRVFKLGAGNYFVARRDAMDDVRLEVFTDDAGKQGVRPVVSTPKRPPKSTGTVSILSGGWTQVAGQCWQYTAEATEQNRCFKMSKYSDSVQSGGGMRDIYALHYWAVTRGGYMGGTPQGIYQSWIKAFADSTSSTMEWADWNPKTNSDGNCRAYTIGFSAGGFSVSQSGTMCEKWSVNRFTAGGEMNALWTKGVGTTVDAREVALGEEVYVPVGGWPVWTLQSQWWYK